MAINADASDFLWMQITGECNLCCSDCVAAGRMSHPRKILKYEDFLAILGEARRRKCTSVRVPEAASALA